MEEYQKFNEEAIEIADKLSEFANTLHVSYPVMTLAIGHFMTAVVASAVLDDAIEENKLDKMLQPIFKGISSEAHRIIKKHL